jgi:hypothetical protein
VTDDARLSDLVRRAPFPEPKETALRSAIEHDPLSKRIYELGQADARRDLLKRLDGYAWGPDGGSVVLRIVRGWLREPIETATP